MFNCVSKIFRYDKVCASLLLIRLHPKKKRYAKAKKTKQDPVQVLLRGTNGILASQQSQGEYPMSLPFAGRVSQVKAQGSFHIATIFGIPFYLHRQGQDLSGDVLVPAWACKVVNRTDLAFWKLETEPLIAYMICRKSKVSRAKSEPILRLSWDAPHDHEKYEKIEIVLWWANLICFFCVISCLSETVPLLSMSKDDRHIM